MAGSGQHRSPPCPRPAIGREHRLELHAPDRLRVPLQHRLDHAGGCPGKPSRPARKAATATSFAALSTAGAVPPASAAARARRRPGSARGPAPRNRAAPAATKSSDCTPESIRSGQPRAWAIGRAHVRVAELGEDRAVHVLHQRMHDALRMYDHLDLRRFHAEQQAGLDQLEPLVHQGGRIDRDLAAHVPARMGAGLLRRDRGESSAAGVRRNGPPEAVSSTRRTPWPGTPGLRAGRQALEDRVVLAVDRDQGGAAAARRLDQQRPGHHQRFLVGEQHALAGSRRRQRRRQAGRADDRRHHGVHRRQCRRRPRARPRPPAPRSCEPAERRPAARRAAASADCSTATRGRCRRHCSSRRASLVAAASTSTVKRSGWRPSTSSVLTPMLPVLPRTATRIVSAPRAAAGRAGTSGPRRSGCRGDRARRRGRAAARCCP